MKRVTTFLLHFHLSFISGFDARRFVLHGQGTRRRNASKHGWRSARAALRGEHDEFLPTFLHSVSVSLLAARLYPLPVLIIHFPSSLHTHPSLQVGAGSLVGQLAVLTDLESLVTVVAECECTLVRISRGPLLQLMSQQPAVVARLASSVLGVLSPLVRQIDFALDWVRGESGKGREKT